MELDTRLPLSETSREGKDLFLEVTFLQDDPRGWVVYESRIFDTDLPNTRDNSLGWIKFAYIPKDNFDRVFPTLMDYAMKVEGRGYLQELVDSLGLAKAIKQYAKTDPKIKDRYAKFRDFWVDKPMPEYASTKTPRMGVGTILYTATNNWIKKNLGLHLWASSNQTDDAKGIWAKFKSKGLSTMEPRPRLLNAASRRVALRYWVGT